MIAHFFKIAFRTMWKYKSQTLISVIGLAIGFTCFAMAMLWIRYEMTYDSFHKKAKQMYVIYNPPTSTRNNFHRNVGYRMALHLKETFPEIADVCPLGCNFLFDKISIEGVETNVKTFLVDASFSRMFDVKILEGSSDFLIPGSKKRAITQKTARRLFGDVNPIGKMINENESICAIVSDMPSHSNYTFELIKPFSESTVTSQIIYDDSHAIIELVPGTNIKAFEKKLYEYKYNETGDRFSNELTMRPITKIRYTDLEMIREVKFQHIVVFSLSGLLIILCSLFNYLTLFVSRFRIRQKELALRMVCGASGGSLMTMLSVEFLLTLFFAVILGSCLTLWLQAPFMALSEIKMGLPAIYGELLLYISGVILIALMVFWMILFIFRKRSLNLSIRRSNKNLSRKISVIVQLVISIGFAFCSLVIMKQMYFLHYSGELGFSLKNRGAVDIWEQSLSGKGELANFMKQIPELTEIVDADGVGEIYNPGYLYATPISSWDEKPAGAENINLLEMRISPEYAAFYELRLIEGEMLTDLDPATSVLLNESAVKAFGWHSPVGKKFGNRTVKGVIRNVYNFAPTIEARPATYSKNDNTPLYIGVNNKGYFIRVVLFKYSPGLWASSKEKIERMIAKEYPGAEFKTVSNTEERFASYLKSENVLVKLLSFVSAICLLICVFGFVSLVSLTCEERRKSIAIRKINGATTDDILAIFAKEYALLLIIGAIIAFSTGYYIMQRWLEQYVKQTDIPAWLYLPILIVMALVIVLCVGWQVYKTSVENPAEVVKRDN